MIVQNQSALQIIAIPAFADNYIWLIHNGSQAIVVDPGDASPVLNTLQNLKLNLLAVLITHHHQDHIGGVNTLIALFPEAQVYAPKYEQYTFKHTPVSETDTIHLGSWVANPKILDVPGHTLGHIAYYFEGTNEKWLFCGDTLFGAGCGRLFEGSPEQMLTSLQKLAALPKETKVYCTHEYTLHNIGFALTLEPNNIALTARHQDTLLLRNQNQPSLPSTIDLELKTNPFLRCESYEIQSSIQLKNASALEVFSTIRLMRNLY